ncbi:MAG TPA: DUF4157 domain-containing protein [Allosphingosinicella sp.]|nr:DUF4157 domain-containing protein [Allosphingosinicella sp.]
MSAAAALQRAAPAPAAGMAAVPKVLQRACACGGGAGASGKCSGCETQEKLGVSRFQRKLEVSAPDDPYEKEADEVADRVMRMPGPAASPLPVSPIVQRDPMGPGDEDEPVAQREAATGAGTAAPSGFAVALGAQSGGAALPAAARSFFEPRFRRDLGHVRIHDGASAGAMARDINARAFTAGSDIYFAPGQYDPASSAGLRLLAHELTHVFQQGGTTGSIQRLCTAAATCGGGGPVAGSPGAFVGGAVASRRSARDRRQAMTPARARSTGHAGRARQLEIVLEGFDPAERALIHGIFVDQDIPSGFAAFNQGCADWRSEALPATDPDPDGMAGATQRCVFVPDRLNQEALAFNNGAATVGGRPRDDWRTDTLVTLTHEVEHARFSQVTEPALPLPAGVTTPTCTRAAVFSDLTEIAAIVREFPLRWDDAQRETNPTGPAHHRLDRDLNFNILTSSQSIQGALTNMGCVCECAEVDLLVSQAVTAVTASMTAPQRAALRSEFQSRLPGPGRPSWPATP